MNNRISKIWVWPLLLVLVLWGCNQAPQTVNTANNSLSKTIIDVRDKGAVGDSTTLCTDAIQAAIDAVSEAGGGQVIVAQGVYLIGTVFLKNNVNLTIMSGARLKGSPNLKDYTKMTWGHNKDRQPWHLLVAKGQKNIEISGGGQIDGNGEAFWEPYDPAKDPQWIMAKDEKISPMVEIQECENVRIKDVLMTTGGGWTLHLYDSDHIQVQGVRIINNMFSPNGDGIDITGCKDVTISDCIIKTCDDAICLKTNGDSRVCKRVVVTNCVIECSCAALKVGNESFRDISQVTFSNCVVYGSSRAVALYAESAGVVEDITVTNIVSDSKSPLLYNRPIHISLLKRTMDDGSLYSGGMYKSDTIYDPEGREPAMRNIMISNFISTTEGRILITAEPGRMVENLTLRDVHLTYPYIEDPLPHVEEAKSHQFSPFNPEAKVAYAAVVAENVKNLVIDGLNITWPATEVIPKEWQFEKRIANGTLKEFFPDYKNAKPVPFSAVWAKNVQGGYIDAPLATPSDAKASTFELINSNISIRK